MDMASHIPYGPIHGRFSMVNSLSKSFRTHYLIVVRFFWAKERVHFSLNESNHHFRAHVFASTHAVHHNRHATDEASHASYLYALAQWPRKIIRIKICPSVDKWRRKDDKLTKKIWEFVVVELVGPDASSVAEFPFFFGRRMSLDYVERICMALLVSRQIYSIQHRVHYTHTFQEVLVSMFVCECVCVRKRWICSAKRKKEKNITISYVE